MQRSRAGRTNRQLLVFVWVRCGHRVTSGAAERRFFLQNECLAQRDVMELCLAETSNYEGQTFTWPFTHRFQNPSSFEPTQLMVIIWKNEIDSLHRDWWTSVWNIIKDLSWWFYFRELFLHFFKTIFWLKLLNDILYIGVHYIRRLIIWQ